MLVSLLSLTKEGRKKVFNSMKEIHFRTEAGGFRQAKDIFDQVRGGQSVTVLLDPSYSPTDSIHELLKYFTLEVTDKEAGGLGRLMVLLTDASELTLLLGLKEEHEALVPMIRGLQGERAEKEEETVSITEAGRRLLQLGLEAELEVARSSFAGLTEHLDIPEDTPFPEIARLIVEDMGRTDVYEQALQKIYESRLDANEARSEARNALEDAGPPERGRKEEGDLR